MGCGAVASGPPLSCPMTSANDPEFLHSHDEVNGCHGCSPNLPTRDDLRNYLYTDRVSVFPAFNDANKLVLSAGPNLDVVTTHETAINPRTDNVATQHGSLKVFLAE